MNRYELREQTFRILFGLTFHENEEKRPLIDNYLDGTCEFALGEAEREELIHRVLDIYERIPELDARLEQVSKSWKVSRMGRPELCILRLALYEMEYDDTVPYKVAINEAVELARAYGEEEAPSFVNGVLARFIKKD